MRKGAVAMLVLIALVVAAITTAVAVFVDWMPDQAAKERERIDLVFWVTTYICIAVFAVVAAVAIYASLKFRAPPDDDSDGPPTHGHTGLEIVWTAIPTVLVIIIGVLSAIVLARNDRAGSNPLEVAVTAQQFAWSFEYPNGVTSANLHVPVGRPVLLRLRARDVIHSFWVREFGQKQDAVPGIETKLVITPTRVGEYVVVCTELCGLGHAVMRTRAIVMNAPDFDAWLRRNGETMAGGGEDAGAAVFAAQGCGGCHTFGPANATGTTGPPLDDIAADAREHGREPEEFVRESIVEPDAFVHEGFPPNLMPEYDSVPEDQLDALVQYLLTGSEGEAQ